MQELLQILRSNTSLDELLRAAIDYIRGRLTLSYDDYRLLLTLLRRQAERLDPGDRIRLDCVTPMKNKDGTVRVHMDSHQFGLPEGGSVEV
jgi:hypothetical protein